MIFQITKPASTRLKTKVAVKNVKYVFADKRREWPLLTSVMIHPNDATSRSSLTPTMTRLTKTFSKKLDDFEAAIALNFGYYDFLRNRPWPMAHHHGRRTQNLKRQRVAPQAASCARWRL